MTELARYDVYMNPPEADICKAAECVLEETNGRLTRFAFRYDPSWHARPASFSLDPAQLPLGRAEFTLHCLRGAPALIDDYLPDAWGRKVLARFALAKDRKRLNANSAIEILGLMGASRIGCLQLVPEGQAPDFARGYPLGDLARAEELARRIDDDSFVPENVDQFELAYLGNGGSGGVGGARPKALFHDDKGCYLAKFNRDADRFNHARIELACLRMAAAAGIDAASGRVESGINGREVLLLDRFDIAADGGRNHLITVNGLLKDPNTQQDPGQSFRYDDIHHLLSRYSVDPEADFEQLLKLMLFNRSINNTDDHERNFSLINRGGGYRLSPAYDLVPSLALGEYHAAGFGYRVSPPTASEVVRLGKVFGLSKATVARCAARVGAAIASWPDTAAEAGVSEREMELAGQRMSQ